MKSFLKNNKRTETLLVLLLTVVWNQSVYYGARWITGSWKHYDMTASFDSLVPFVPWTIIIYFGCYLFWAVNYYLCAIQPQEERNRFFCADVLAKTICLLIFLLLPTTNIRPEIVGNSVWDNLMRLLYQIDAADNLFPSIHCLVSWFCWIGVRKRKEIPWAYRYFSLIAALAVCISTLTTRQHVMYDVFSGILIAEGCYFLSGFAKIRAPYTYIISVLLKPFIK